MAHDVGRASRTEILWRGLPAFTLVGVALTWPDVPWPTLFIAGVLGVGILPVLTYLVVKPLWLAVDYLIRTPWAEREPVA